MLAVPATHRFPELAKPYCTWGWHRVSDLVEAHNNLKSDPSKHITATTLFDVYAHLNRKTRIVNTDYALGETPTFFSYRDGVVKEWGCKEHGLTGTVMLTDDDYVPAGWGMAIIKANPISNLFRKVLSIGGRF